MSVVRLIIRNCFARAVVVTGEVVLVDSLGEARLVR